MTKTNERKRPYTRAARIVRVAIACLCLTWFGRFAYVRSTTMPPGVARSAPAETPDDDATAELAGAIARLPGFAGAMGTTTTRPGRPGMLFGGVGELPDALRGEWTPQSRPYLTTIIKHIKSPNVDAVLDQIVDLSGERWTISDGFSATTAIVTPWSVNEPINALLVRARLKHAERNDVAGALSDLLAALRLCAPSTRQSVFWRSYSQASLVAAQIRFMAIERDIPVDESAAILDYVRVEFPDSISDGMLAGLSLQGTAEQILDRFYTDDGDGDGWLVVSELGQVYASPGTDSGARGRFWNVLSPLFNGRAAIAGKFEQYLAEFVRIDMLAYDAALDAFKQLQERRLFSVTDGPFVQLASKLNEWTFQGSVNNVLARRAAVLALALSAFKNDHGAYPESLDDLTPDYLDRIPIDVLTAKPLEYRRSNSGYVLNEGQMPPTDIMIALPFGGSQPEPQPIYARSRAAPLHEPASVGGK